MAAKSLTDCLDDAIGILMPQESFTSMRKTTMVEANNWQPKRQSLKCHRRG